MLLRMILRSRGHFETGSVPARASIGTHPALPQEFDDWSRSVSVNFAAKRIGDMPRATALLAVATLALLSACQRAAEVPAECAQGGEAEQRSRGDSLSPQGRRRKEQRDERHQCERGEARR